VKAFIGGDTDGGRAEDDDDDEKNEEEDAYAEETAVVGRSASGARSVTDVEDEGAQEEEEGEWEEEAADDIDGIADVVDVAARAKIDGDCLEDDDIPLFDFISSSNTDAGNEASLYTPDEAGPGRFSLSLSLPSSFHSVSQTSILLSSFVSSCFGGVLGGIDDDDAVVVLRCWLSEKSDLRDGNAGRSREKSWNDSKTCL